MIDRIKETNNQYETNDRIKETSDRIKETNNRIKETNDQIKETNDRIKETSDWIKETNYRILKPNNIFFNQYHMAYRINGIERGTMSIKKISLPTFFISPIFQKLLCEPKLDQFGLRENCFIVASSLGV